MKARDATRHAPVQLPAHATIGEAARLMDTEAVGAVVITDSSTAQPIGIVTDRDLVVQALARDIPTDGRVDDVMSSGLVCIDADADLHEAVRLFATHPIRRLPVVSESELVGMLTIDDLMVDLASDLGNLAKGVTAQLLFGHRKPSLPVPSEEGSS